MVSTLADSYVSSTATRAVAAAELASSPKADKYAHLPGSYIFRPIATETLGSYSVSLLSDLGRKISTVTSDDRQGLFLFQRLSVTMQRFNAIHPSIHPFINMHKAAVIIKYKNAQSTMNRKIYKRNKINKSSTNRTYKNTINE